MVSLRAVLEATILLKRGIVMKTLRTVAVGLAVGMDIAYAAEVAQVQAIDNSSIGKPDFREHVQAACTRITRPGVRCDAISR